MQVRRKLGKRVRKALGRFVNVGPGAARIEARRVTFRLMYERFREILILNDATLEVIADIEELLGGKRRFSLEATALRIRKAAMDVFLMVKDLNQIADRRHKALYEVLYRINDQLEAELTTAPDPGTGKLVIPLRQLRVSDAPLVGSKMANLGEIRAMCGLAVPDGFAITTAAFLRFMAHGSLWTLCEQLETCLDRGREEETAEACRKLQDAVLCTAVPEDVAGAIREAFAEHFPDAHALVALRSSAVGEDTEFSSHAGLYHTELNTGAARLLDAYRKVLASTFSPTAVSYRFQRGITIRDSLMAVGCIRMVQPRCAGILFSRLPDEPDRDAFLVSAVPGSAAGIAAGAQTAETVVIQTGNTEIEGMNLLQPAETAALQEAARMLESHFGMPQDIEWAIDEDGIISFLQTRPMIAVNRDNELPRPVFTDQRPILEGGSIACPGIGAGSVVIVDGNYDLARFPAGGVLAARHSSPAYARIMTRCSAIVTDVGSPTGHMSSLAREFGIPTIVGLNRATRLLTDGQPVTVDAWTCRIYDGILESAATSPRSLPALADSPALGRLRRIARLVTPLAMTDPESPDFRPETCRSLHDITRYVHELAFEVMFHYGDLANADRDHAVRLQARLPIRVEIFNVGGGIQEQANLERGLLPGDVSSVPMQSFLKGLLDPRIRWDLPRPVSVRGFLSVLGESITGPPPDSSRIGRLSYAIISDRYMNFSTKAGYHFSTLDTYCGRSVNKNYIHFRFSGGAADVGRRERRIRFVSRILTSLDFNVQVRGDMLVARLNKFSAEDIQSRLISLGRLTLCARQLDMLMDDDTSPERFADAFLAGEWQKF